jgi:hypothetical protein
MPEKGPMLLDVLQHLLHRLKNQHVEILAVLRGCRQSNLVHLDSTSIQSGLEFINDTQETSIHRDGNRQHVERNVVKEREHRLCAVVSHALQFNLLSISAPLLVAGSVL